MNSLYKSILNNNNLKFSIRYFSRCSAKIDNKLHDYFTNIGLSSTQIKILTCRNRKLKSIDPDNVENILRLLETQYDIDRHTAITEYPMILSRKSSALKEYTKVMQECGFKPIKLEYLISYFPIMKHRSIKDLKKHSILSDQLNVYECLCQCFKLWTTEDYNEDSSKLLKNDLQTLFDLRLHILRKYLEWRLNISNERFTKMIKTYNRFYHRPLGDMEESLNIAEGELKMPKERILKNVFVICADPVNTMNIINKVKKFHGIDAREALYSLTLLIKEDYTHIMKVNDILKLYDIPMHCKKRVLKLYVYKPKELKKRLDVFKTLPELIIFSTNRRFPVLVEFKKHVLSRMTNLQKENRKCISLALLTCSNQTFQSFSQNFADKYPPGDVLYAIYGNLKSSEMKDITSLKNYLSRHDYFTNVPIMKIVNNIQQLKQLFTQEDIYINCHLLLYSIENINEYLYLLLKLRLEHIERKFNKLNIHFVSNPYFEEQKMFIKNYKHESNDATSLFQNNESVLTELSTVDFSALNNNQILNLVMYFIERKFGFSCNGIWQYESNEQ